MSTNEKIAGLGFHHVGLKVANFDRSLELYQNLGFKLVKAWGEGDGRAAMLDIGDGGRIEIFAGGGDHIPEKGKWVHFAMRADDVDAAYGHALAVGCTSVKAPYTVEVNSKPEPMKLHIAFVAGYDGEELEFFSEV